MANDQKNQPGIQTKLVCALTAAAIIPFISLSVVVGIDVLWTPQGLAALGMVLLSVLLGWAICRRSIQQARAIHQTIQRINEGDFEARVDVITDDDLGDAAESLNVMCDNTLNLVQSHIEKGDVQTSIENLVCQVESIAAGDLTISAAVNSNVTGSIASSVNNMTEQLRSIVQQVQTATEQVNVSATSIRQASTELSRDSELHAQEINEASQRLRDMTDSFQDVAAKTAESVNVAVEARQTASDGLKAVTDTVEGMQRIRTQVQNTSKRIKRLGESSQEIGEIVQLISDIADRTSILALNASIQAAMAGDAGQGFAVVAEEVERLAERSALATGQVARLIRGIQAETNEVIADMEESTREVVTGSQLATQAGETLFEIDSVSDQLVELIESVSASAQSQALNATTVASTMQQLSQGTRESAEKSRRATHSVNQLAQMAHELQASIARFKVARPSAPGTRSVASPSPLTDGAPRDLMSQLRAVSRLMDDELQEDGPVFADKPRIGATVSSTIMMPEDAG